MFLVNNPYALTETSGVGSRPEKVYVPVGQPIEHSVSVGLFEEVKSIIIKPLHNRPSDVFKRVNSDWLEIGRSKDAVRKDLIER